MNALKILAVDTSAKAASAAVVEDGKIIAESYINTKITHSQTILPMVKSILEACGQTIEQIDTFAVSVGPGSFTGLRIGISLVKGLAFSTQKKCVPVSTLEALCHNVSAIGRICAVMDARCSQVYTATFDFDGEKYTRITEDEAISLVQLEENVKKCKKPVVFVGDGAEMCYNKLKDTCDNVLLASENVRFQRASSVAFVAEGMLEEGKAVSAEELVPSYLRLPQAQRERIAKMG